MGLASYEERLPKQIAPDELADRIEKTCGDTRLGRLNRQHVKPYSWGNVLSELCNVLDELEGGRGLGPAS
ncbi:MAG: hypothetical protein ACETWE_00220 [Candidatus Bathyarchaeia archaeon]